MAHITFTDFLHLGFLFPSQPSVHKQFYIVLSTGEAQMLLLHQIKYFYKFGMQIQHYIAFTSLHNSQPVIHPAREWLNSQQAQFLLHVFTRKVEYVLCSTGAVGGKYETCFNKSCSPKARADNSGQTWIINLVFILTGDRARDIAIEN